MEGSVAQRTVAVLAEIVRALDSETAVDARLRALGLALTESFDADRCIISRVAEGVITAVGGHALGAAGTRAYARLPAGRGIVGRVAREGRIERVDDVLHDPDYFAAIALTRSELAVPVVHAGRVGAVLYLEANRLAAFTPDDEEVLAAVARHLAGDLGRLGLG